MAQITVDSTPSTRHPSRAAGRSPGLPPVRPSLRRVGRPAEQPDEAEEKRWGLRQSAPVAVAVALLFGLTLLGSLALRDVLDLGVWLLSAS